MSDDICASESQAVALATKRKRSSRQFTRQLTFVDIERSFTTAGEIETPDVLRNGGLQHQNGYWNGNGNNRYSNSNDRPVAIVIGTGNTVSLFLRPLPYSPVRAFEQDIYVANPISSL